MSEIKRLIFEDLVLCFFCRGEELNNPYWRKYFLHGEDRFLGLMEAFPENEVCESEQLQAIKDDLKSLVDLTNKYWMKIEDQEKINDLKKKYGWDK